MTIHHDKLAYGKLAKLNKDMSDEEILKMLKELAEEAEPENEPDEKVNSED